MKNRNTLVLSCALLALFAGSVSAIAQEATKAEEAPATTPAATTTIVVKTVIGKVRFKADANAALAELKEGQTLTEGAEIFTGPNSQVQIQIGTGQVFTIDRLGRVIIREAINNGKDKTTLQMPYGRVKFEITSTQVANDVKIQAPDATLAVKGTIGVMETIPGQGSRAYGGELNTGIFNVMYAGGVNVDVKQNFETQQGEPSTAGTEDAGTYLETGDTYSRDKNSRQYARWSPTFGRLEEGDYRRNRRRSFLNPTPGGNNKDPIDESLFFDVSDFLGRDIAGHDLKGDDNPLAGNLAGFDGDAVGSAVWYDDDKFSIVALDNSAGKDYQSGTMALRQWNPGTGTWTLLGVLPPIDCGYYGNNAIALGGKGGPLMVPYDLDGLGQLDNRLYASGRTWMECEGSTGNTGIYELIAPEVRGGSFQAVQRMSFPGLEMGGGLTGANDRGSMFMTAQMYNTTPFQAGGLVLLEVDPRLNYVYNAWSSGAGDFAIGPNTQVRPSESYYVPSGYRATGLAYSQGRVIIAGEYGKGDAVMTVVDPGVRSHGQSRVDQVRIGTDNGAIRTRALAGEGGRNAAPSPTIGPAERPITGLTGIDSIWLNTSYSRDAALSPTFQAMVAQTVLSLVPNPQAYANSPGFQSALRNAIKNHIDQQRGIGQAIQEFQNSGPLVSPAQTVINR